MRPLFCNSLRPNVVFAQHGRVGVRSLVVDAVPTQAARA